MSPTLQTDVTSSGTSNPQSSFNNRRKIYPPKHWNSAADAYKSIYSNSDDTSCYGSDTSSSTPIWTDSEEDRPKQSYISYKTDFDYTLNAWQIREGSYRKTDNKQSNRIFNNNNIPTRKQVEFVQQVSRRYGDSEYSISASKFKDTVLSDFLEDVDKIDECDYPRQVKSEDGDSESSQQDCSKSQLAVKPSPMRWFVLVLICISIGVRSFVSVVFGQINDIFSTYFDVGPSAVDWLTNTGSVATLCTIITLIFCGGRFIKLRWLCLFMTGTASLGTCLLSAAMTNREYGYGLGIAGQVAMGLNNAVAMSIAPLTAATWFPDGQVATALSVTLIFVGFGEALGSYLPGVVVFTTELVDMEFEGSGSGDDQESEFIIDGDLEDSIRYKLIVLFATPAVISVITFLVALVFFKERPYHPPSEAQALIRERSLMRGAMSESERSELVSISRSSVPASFFMSASGTKQLLKNNSFVLITFIYGVVAASGSTSITLLSSMLPYISDENDTLNSDELSGRIMAVLWVCFTIGPFITGIVLDKTHKYRETAVVTVFGLTLGSVGIPISLYFSSVTGLYISHAITGFFMGAAETTLFEIAAETTYPSPELTFASVLNVSWVTFFVIYPVAGRFILNEFEEAGAKAAATASICPAIFTGIAALVAMFFLRPVYRRHAGNQSKNNKQTNERTPLIRKI